MNTYLFVLAVAAVAVLILLDLLDDLEGGGALDPDKFIYNTVDLFNWACLDNLLLIN